MIMLTEMSPRIIEDQIFNNRKEITTDVIRDLEFSEGAENLKDLLVTKWKHCPDDTVAVPCLTVNTVGKVSGAKWYLVGKLMREVNVKLTQLNSDADDDVVLSIKINDLGIFPFYNKRRNVSGWVDSSEVDFNLNKKVKSKKQQVDVDQYTAVGFKGFSLRVGVTPISATSANIVLALHPLGKDELKAKIPDFYYKNGCPQVALSIGDNNSKYLCVPMMVQEPPSCGFGMGILPAIEDLRSEQERISLHPSSWELRVACNAFLRSLERIQQQDS